MVDSKDALVDCGGEDHKIRFSEVTVRNGELVHGKHYFPSGIPFTTDTPIGENLLPMYIGAALPSAVRRQVVALIDADLREETKAEIRQTIMDNCIDRELGD